MKRRTTLVTLAGVIGFVGSAFGKYQDGDTIRALKVTSKTKEGNLVFRDAIKLIVDDKEHAGAKMKMQLSLQDFSEIVVEFDGQVKTISPKELFEAL